MFDMSNKITVWKNDRDCFMSSDGAIWTAEDEFNKYHTHIEIAEAAGYSRYNVSEAFMDELHETTPFQLFKHMLCDNDYDKAISLVPFPNRHYFKVCPVFRGAEVDIDENEDDLSINEKTYAILNEIEPAIRLAIAKALQQ